MIYGMEDDNNEFALVAKPKLNMKKIYLFAGIGIVAFIFMFVFLFSGTNKENTSVEDYALNSGEEIESNPTLITPEENNESAMDAEGNNGEEPQIQTVRFF